MIYKYILPFILLCLTSVVGFCKEEEKSFTEYLHTSHNDQLVIKSENDPLFMDYSTESQSKNWKYRLGDWCVTPISIWHDGCDEGGAGAYLSPGCLLAAFTVGIPGCLACAGHHIPTAVWVVGGTTSGVCGVCWFPMILCGRAITTKCAVTCCASYECCTDFVDGIQDVSGRQQREHQELLQKGYLESIDTNLKYLEDTITKWNNHMTSAEENKQTVITLFNLHIKKYYDIDLNWNNNNALSPLKEKLPKNYKEGNATNNVKNILTKFYDDEATKEIRPKRFDVFQYFK